MVSHEYSVTARVSVPPFEAERRYVMMETELAEREMAKLPARSWLPFSYPGLGLLRRTDWSKYIRALEKYGRDLERHEQEVQGGLLPISFSVANHSQTTDFDIKIHVMVHGGMIHPSKKPPRRPVRIDGAANKGSGRRFEGFDGFVRKRIHIGRHGVEAEFSKLDGQDNALVVNHPLYLDMRPETTLSYEIRSHVLPHGQTGDVSYHSQN